MAGRPRSFDRNQALDVAVEQFWRHGYEETTVATLTQAMGIAPPSLYAAFGDKDRLFAEAAECYIGAIVEAMDAAFADVGVREGIAEMVRLTAAAHTDTATPLGCFVLTEPRLADQRAQLTERIAAHIDRGVARAELPADTDAQHLASFLVAVMAGMSARARDGGSAEEVNAIAELALAAVT
jgi:AcrR family transcriptional regulator